MSITCAVAITTYYGERFLAEQLDSIVCQTRQPDRIYIYDDHSEDRTVGMIKEYAGKYPEINWLITINEENKGWKRNFHDMLYAVEEDVVFLCDQDDIWMPDKIENMMEEFEKAPEIELLACDYTPLYMDNESKISDRFVNFMKEIDSVQPIPFDRHFIYVMRPGCTMAARKSFVNAIMPCWDGEVPHDAMLWRYALIRNSAYYMNKPLIQWRRYRSSSSSKYSKNASENNEYQIRYQHSLGSVKAHIRFLRTIDEYRKGYTIPEAKQRIIDDLERYENTYQQALESKSLARMLYVSIRYHRYFLTFRSLIADLIMIIKCK